MSVRANGQGSNAVVVRPFNEPVILTALRQGSASPDRSGQPALHATAVIPSHHENQPVQRLGRLCVALRRVSGPSH